MKIRMTEADIERLGCPEWLDVDLSSLPVREAIAMELATRLTTAEVLELAKPTITQVDAGRHVTFTGQAMKLRVWLGLHRAGIEADYDTLDFDFSPHAAGYLVPDEEPGKADSATSSPSTASTSPTSGRRTRSKTSPK